MILYKLVALSKNLGKLKEFRKKKCLNFWIFHILHTQIIKIKKVSDILEISTDSLIETAKTKSKTFIDEIDMYVEKFQKDIAERGYNREMGDIELLKYFRKLNYEGQDKAIDYTKLLSESPKYQKDYTKDNGTVYAAHEPTDIENTNNSEE